MRSIFYIIQGGDFKRNIPRAPGKRDDPFTPLTASRLVRDEPKNVELWVILFARRFIVGNEITEAPED